MTGTMAESDASLFTLEPAKPAGQMHPQALAYLGDAVFELYVRQYLLSLPNHRPHALHREAIGLVSARAQARLLEEWMPLLSEDELEIVRRGRNAKTGSMPKNAEVLEYRHSTAFECLIGYLFCERKFERLKELLDQAVRKIGG